jgi:hypothetical protein
LDYTLNEKYSIEYSSVYNYTRITSEIELMESDNELNPYLDIHISIDAFCDPFVAIYKMIKGKPILLEEKYDETTGVELAYYELKEKVNDTEFAAVLYAEKIQIVLNFITLLINGLIHTLVIFLIIALVL